MATMAPGDVVIIFTPDDTHYPICCAAIRHRLHVLVAKPLVKTLQQHRQLVDLAEEHGVLVCVEGGGGKGAWGTGACVCGGGGARGGWCMWVWVFMGGGCV